MTDTDDELTIASAILAVLAASFMGTALLVLYVTTYGAIADGTAAAVVPRQIFNMAIILWPPVFIAFAAAAIFIAGPCWAVLHLMGRRTWIEAAVLGALTACAAVLLVPGLTHMTMLVVSGTIAALTAWRVTYGAQQKTGGIAPARSVTSV